GAVAGVDGRVVGDVVAVVAEGGGIEGQDPDGGDAKVGDVVEFLGEADEIADAVAVAVREGADVNFVEDGVLIPQRVGDPGRAGHGGGFSFLGDSTSEGREDIRSATSPKRKRGGRIASLACASGW